MAREEIVNKLALFLEKYNPLLEECLVVYLLVELAKIIDHTKKSRDFPLIKFFRDWAVHTSKDRQMKAIKEIAKKILDALAGDGIPSNENYEKVLKFLTMPELKKEMSGLFNNEELPCGLFEDDKWKIFTKTLTRVLSQQPINKPIDGIDSLVLHIDSHGSQIEVNLPNGSHTILMSHDVY